MKAGFAWDLGPFEYIGDLLGIDKGIELAENNGYPSRMGKRICLRREILFLNRRIESIQPLSSIESIRERKHHLFAQTRKAGLLVKMPIRLTWSGWWSACFVQGAATTPGWRCHQRSLQRAWRSRKCNFARTLSVGNHGKTQRRCQLRDDRYECLSTRMDELNLMVKTFQDTNKDGIPKCL